MNLTIEQTDAFREVVNIGVGRAAASLGQLVGEHIELKVPQVQICSLNKLSEIVEQSGKSLDTLVLQEFNGGANGRSLLGFSHSSCTKLAKLLGGIDVDDDEDDDECVDSMDIDMCGILEEVGNIVLNGVLGSLANIMNSSLVYSVPELHTEAKVEDILKQTVAIIKEEEESILYADAHFKVANRDICGTLVIAFELNGINSVLRRIMNVEEQVS